MNSFTNKLHHFLNPTRWYLFIGIAFLFQLYFLQTFNSFENPNSSNLYFLKGDGIQYINYCENFYKYGSYFEGTKYNVTSYTNRMPGMCVIYTPLRIIFNQQQCLNAFVIVQALFASITSYLLAKIALLIFKKKQAFYYCFILFSTSTFCANYLHILYTESLALSAIILSCFFLFKYFFTKRKYFLAFSLSFLVWTIFLRPFIAPIILLLSAYILLLLIRKEIKISYFLILMILVISPFSIWTIRNYQKTQSFIPLQSGENWINATQAIESKTKFIKCFGLGWVWWDSKSEHSWFLNDEELLKYSCNRFPDSLLLQRKFCPVFSEYLPIDSLKKARYYYWKSNDTKMSLNTRNLYAIKASTIFEKYILYQKKTRPFDYYISSRLIVLFKFLNQSHAASIKSFKYPYNVVLTFFDAIINYFVLIGGSISMFIYLFLKNKKNEIIILTIIPIFLMLYFSINQRDELRYFALSFPFLILLSYQGLIMISESRFSKIFFILLTLLLIYGGIYSVIHDIKW